MSSAFRNLRDGYEYQVGRTYVCIRNKAEEYRELVLKEDVGQVVGVKPLKVVVTPGMIDYWLKNKEKSPAKNHFYSCGHDGARLSVNPYADEIYRKTHYAHLCDDCLAEIALDI